MQRQSVRQGSIQSNPPSPSASFLLTFPCPWGSARPEGAETLITYPPEYIANRDGVRQEREPLLWEAVTGTW